MAHLTGIPVRVGPAAGPRDPGDWSGLPVEERTASPRAEAVLTASSSTSGE